MKYLCEGCERLVVPARFALEAGALLLTCERCGATTRAEPGGAATAGGAAPAQDGAEAAVAAPTPAEPRPPAALRVVALRPSGETVRQAAALARSEDPFAPPPGHCPKCLAPRDEDGLICPRCGLVYANFIAAEHRPSAPLGEAWVELLAHWDDEPRHERFLQLALARGELAGAGRLYRLRLAQAPQDLFAQRGRDEVLRLASASSSAALAAESRGSGGGPSPRLRSVAVAVLALLLLIAAVLLLRQLSVLLAGPSP